MSSPSIKVYSDNTCDLFWVALMRNKETGKYIIHDNYFRSDYSSKIKDLKKDFTQVGFDVIKVEMFKSTISNEYNSVRRRKLISNINNLYTKVVENSNKLQ